MTNERRPLWQRDEDETTGDSIERLLARHDFQAIADSLDEDSVLPKELFKEPTDVLAVATIILDRKLVLQPDDAYWYVERFIPGPARRLLGRPVSSLREFKAVR
jgi:hypothetical protein